MNIPKVSIIVPVYKVELYLQQCIDSIRSQTLRDIEIILIDDGSPDRCPQICNEFALEDNRIRVIHQENAGVSVARNRGIEEATAEWIMFVDSDDWLELNAVEKLWKMGNQSGADMIVALLAENFPDREIKPTSSSARDEMLPVAKFKDALLGATVIPAEKYKFLFPNEMQNLQILSYPVAKLYRKRVLIDAGIRFPLGIKIGEDKIFNLQMILASQAVYFTAFCAYHYRKRTGSACNSFSDDQIDLRLQHLRKMELIINKYHLGENFTLYWYIDVIIFIFRLTELRGMNMHGLKSCAKYADEMRIFSEDKVCRQALKNIGYHKMPSTKHKLLLWFIKHGMFKTAIIVCKCYYILVPHKNRLNYFE